MNDMLDRLQRATERQQRFVADASHDLRSPLARMRARLEIGSGDVDPLLEDVIEMQRLVEDLLYLARVDEGLLAIDAVPLDLDDLVLREVHRLEARQRVGVDYSHLSGAHVTGDPGQLTRAVRNLVDNAERHATSVVTLSLAESNGTAILTVADDGPGVATEDAEVIFERFRRLDDARSTETGGAGLGLAIARDIVERHGGTVRLEPTGGRGATFEMTMPLA
jgi:signal transduction histidine kinase